ncbi:hypothetical protein GUJ93_ZPchr0016g2543 [Zizania palustris]|uniref:Uncharacterized protein n=1 Tax=Zizania palustris TaxID=103762 RepID=A0A8J5T9C7_ZIZPA|nr:hypothetical protein GUJ93_ZPchr0016g2543 [Zizania palustris]
MDRPHSAALHDHAIAPSSSADEDLSITRFGEAAATTESSVDAAAPGASAGHLLGAGSSVMETTDGQAARRLSFESWLDESEALVGSSPQGFITPTKKPSGAACHQE